MARIPIRALFGLKSFQKRLAKILVHPVTILAIATVFAVVLGAEHLTHAQDQLPQKRTVHMLKAWYRGISALEYGVASEHTAAPLVIELDTDTRLTVPPHLAEQEVVAVQKADLGPGLERAVIVGVDARTADGLRQAYVLVYGRREGQMYLQAELPLREHFGRFEQARVSRDEPVLIITGFSGTHFTDLWVYRFVNEEPGLLFANGSASGAEFRSDVTTPVPTIWIAAEDWGDPEWSFGTGERRWMIYTWDGRKFVYNERLSSAREMSVKERLAFYTLSIMETVKQFKEDGTYDRLSQGGLSEE